MLYKGKAYLLVYVHWLAHSVLAETRKGFIMLTVNNQPVPKFLVAKVVAFLDKKLPAMDLQLLLQKYTQDDIDNAFLMASELYKLEYNSFGSVYFSQVDLHLIK